MRRELAPLLVAMLSSAVMTARHVVIAPATVGSGAPLAVNGDAGERAAWVEIRAAMRDNRDAQHKSPCTWGYTWCDSTATSPWSVTLSWGNTDYATHYDRRYATVTVSRGDSVVESSAFENGVDLYGGSNSMALDFKDGMLTVMVGNRQLTPLAPVSVGMHPSQLNVVASGTLTVERGLVSFTEADDEPQYSTVVPDDELERRLSETQGTVEGLWQYLDRENDPELCQLGGAYKLAVVKVDDSYEIIYLDGARVGADMWRRGMVKGRLYPTIFRDSFNATWRAADGREMGRECEISASIESGGAVLAIRFPLIDSVIRFSRSRRGH